MEKNFYKDTYLPKANRIGKITGYLGAVLAFLPAIALALVYGLLPTGSAPHTWQATAASGSTLGEKGALHAARVIAGIAYDLCNKPELREAITKEFLEERTDYKPMYSEA